MAEEDGTGQSKLDRHLGPPIVATEDDSPGFCRQYGIEQHFDISPDIIVGWMNQLNLNLRPDGPIILDVVQFIKDKVLGQLDQKVKNIRSAAFGDGYDFFSRRIINKDDGKTAFINNDSDIRDLRDRIYQFRSEYDGDPDTITPLEFFQTCCTAAGRGERPAQALEGPINYETADVRQIVPNINAVGSMVGELGSGGHGIFNSKGGPNSNPEGIVRANAVMAELIQNDHRRSEEPFEDGIQNSRINQTEYDLMMQAVRIGNSTNMGYRYWSKLGNLINTLDFSNFETNPWQIVKEKIEELKPPTGVNALKKLAGDE